ncbi:hypothetical protein [Endozoicomonas sp. GU-1]|uniref:hypothetical protein n=1 Tax=Endozoicomonas sp. GU-1 TaxID=3009078 RepID=UPI0022B4A0DE|nr:hypothetical protein [Endozoicomonas sp. GU-1]WBA82869.1 hypothetical protein O2T12_07005 [Endozoicomonas sp. GU-1]WBA85797.1 hypothetical protein O3276_21650 [Endozoicomonas sp. GU-1]
MNGNWLEDFHVYFIKVWLKVVRSDHGQCFYLNHLFNIKRGGIAGAAIDQLGTPGMGMN